MHYLIGTTDLAAILNINHHIVSSLVERIGDLLRDKPKQVTSPYLVARGEFNTSEYVLTAHDAAVTLYCHLTGRWPPEDTFDLDMFLEGAPKHQRIFDRLQEVIYCYEHLAEVN